MERYWLLLRKLGKLEDSPALNIEISNGSVAEYLAEYLEENELELSEEAFGNLIAGNEYLRETNFNEIIGYELKYKNYHKFSKTFYINEKHKMLED